jgi:hypothetical protein
MLLTFQNHCLEFQSLPQNLKKNWQLLLPANPERFYQDLLAHVPKDNILLLPLEVRFLNGTTLAARDLIREIRKRKIWIRILVMGFEALVGLLRENPGNVLLCSPGVHYLRFYSEVKDWRGFLNGICFSPPTEAEMAAYLSPVDLNFSSNNESKPL